MVFSFKYWKKIEKPYQFSDQTIIKPVSSCQITIYFRIFLRGLLNIIYCASLDIYLYVHCKLSNDFNFILQYLYRAITSIMDIYRLLMQCRHEIHWDIIS